MENASGRVAGFGDLVEGGCAEQHGNRCQNQEQCHAIEQAARGGATVRRPARRLRCIECP